jgi:hypothetical protein
MHGVEYGYASSSFNNIWTKNANRDHEHNLRNNELYRLPHIRLELFRKIPLYLLLSEWNILGNLTFQRNKALVRNLLKEKLLEETE